VLEAGDKAPHSASPISRGRRWSSPTSRAGRCWPTFTRTR